MLIYYTKQWENYQFSSRVVSNLCQYLNRHWVRREQDENTDGIFTIYDLALVTWKECLFKDLHKAVTTKAVRLSPTHPAGLGAESARFIEMIQVDA